VDTNATTTPCVKRNLQNMQFIVLLYTFDYHCYRCSLWVWTVSQSLFAETQTVPSTTQTIPATTIEEPRVYFSSRNLWDFQDCIKNL